MQVSKYSGSGNDFVIFHALYEIDRSSLAIKLCDRYEGIGADGMIVLLPHDKYDFKWQFYNRDGSEASMCGNGTRACAHYAFSNNFAKSNMKFLTKSGVINANVEKNIVETQLTKPIVLSEPFNEYDMLWHFYDTGVPHLVTYVKDLKSDWNEDIVKKMREKYNANVNFVTLTNPLRIITYERGVEGITQACGTGMAASFLGAFKDGKVGTNIKIMPPSGEVLEVRIDGKDLYFKGKVKHVFDATIKDIEI